MSIYTVKRKNYSNDVDYTDEINKAVAKGDYTSAGNLEKLRNEKIDGEKLGYQKTYNYMDIGTELQNAMKNGASADKVNELRTARENKIRSNEQYSPYFNDEIQQQAAKYYYNSINGVGGNYENRPQYSERYSTEVDNLVNEILNKKDFSYDLESDPNYQAYKEAAVREGRKAMQNVLAEQSMAAGGNNSYAVSAAAQAQNNYLSKLNDVVPTLYSNAYDRYLNEISNDKNSLQMLLGMQDSDYNKYLNNYNIWDNDRARANAEYEAEYERNYAENRDQINDALTDKNYARETVNMLLQQGQQPNEALLKAAGYDGLSDAIANIAANQGRAIDLGFKGQELDLESQRLGNLYTQKQIDNYGLSRSSGKSSSKKSSSGDEDETIINVIDNINSRFKKEFGSYSSTPAIEETNKGWKVNVDADFIIGTVDKMDDLSDEEKNEILTQEFGISDKTIDEHFRRQSKR